MNTTKKFRIKIVSSSPVTRGYLKMNSTASSASAPFIHLKINAEVITPALIIKKTVPAAADHTKRTGMNL